MSVRSEIDRLYLKECVKYKFDDTPIFKAYFLSVSLEKFETSYPREGWISRLVSRLFMKELRKMIKELDDEIWSS